LVVVLTLGAAVHAERAVCELDLGRPVLEVPLLLRRIVERFAVGVERNKSGAVTTQAAEGVVTYTIVVLPLVRAFGTMTNLGFTLEVMYTVR
jgi:hypothetical protein